MEYKTLKYFDYVDDKDIYFQMALDELLFFESMMSNLFFIRVYSVIKPSITFGYFYKTKVSDTLLPCTRRITGGGLVEHDKDIILSFAFSKINNIRDVSFYYDIIHKTIKKVLCDLFPFDFNLTMLDNKNNSLRVCFNSPVKSDIILNGKKIVGGALARKKDFFLYQGSIQLNELKINKRLIEKFILKCIYYFENEFHMKTLNSSILNALSTDAQYLAGSKYEQESWIWKF